VAAAYNPDRSAAAEVRLPAVGRQTQADRASFRSSNQPKGCPYECTAAVLSAVLSSQHRF
jgi:glutamine synthetase